MASCCYVLSLLIMVAMPWAFLAGALVLVPKQPEALQALLFQGLVVVVVFVQILAAAGPIASGLVQAAIGLPQLVSGAVDAMQASIGEKLEMIVKAILGDNSMQMVVTGAIKIITGLLGPAIQTAAKICDIGIFLPSFITDLSALGPILGLFLFVAFMATPFPILMLFLPYKVGIVTGGITLLMFGLLIASLMAHKIAFLLVFVMQTVLNYAFRTVLGTLIPTDTLDSALKTLLGSNAPDMTALKNSLLDMCYLNLTAPPKREKKRSFREVATDSAATVGPALKRLRSDPRGTSREAFESTLASSKRAAGASRELAVSTGKGAAGGIKGCCGWLASLPRTIVTIVKAVPGAIVALCRAIVGFFKSSLRCCGFCLCMCPQFLVAVAMLAVGVAFAQKYGYLEQAHHYAKIKLEVPWKALQQIK